MQTWEYRVADFTKLDRAVPELNALGAEGWEAVALVTTWGAGWRLAHPVALLKRPQPASRDGATRQTPPAAARHTEPAAPRAD